MNKKQKTLQKRTCGTITRLLVLLLQTVPGISYCICSIICIKTNKTLKKRKSTLTLSHPTFYGIELLIYHILLPIQHSFLVFIQAHATFFFVICMVQNE